MVWCTRCGSRNDINEDDKVILLFDEEDEGSRICHHCMVEHFNPKCYRYRVEKYDLGSDEKETGAIYDDNWDTYVEWYINNNCGLANKYYVAIWSDKRGRYIKKTSLKLTE